MVLISHPSEEKRPQTPLIAHTLEVGETMVELNNLEGDEIDTLCRIIGYCHDIPKATDEFQNYLRTDDDKKSPHNHAPTAAVLTLASAIENPVNFTKEQLTIAYCTVYYHHRSRLDNSPPHTVIFEHHTSLDNDDSGSIINAATKRIKQIIESDNEQFLFTVLSSATKKDISSTESIINLIDSAQKWLDKNASSGLAGENDSLISNESYEVYLSLWSNLALSDISHSARISVPRLFERPTREVLEQTINELKANDEIDKYREKARQEVLETVKDISWDTVDIGTLSLPTGLGKTFTGMTAALQILDEKNEISNEPSSENYHANGKGNIIYALPYTSIIDQTADTFSGVFDVSCVHSSRLTVHHYLSDTVTGSSVADEGAFLGESWFSGVTITTFVQLFESLLSPTRTTSTKLPQLQNSVIIVDEPQSVPRSWWALLQRLAETLVNKYNAHIISMTATQPHIFKKYDSISSKSLLDNPEYYYKQDCTQRIEYSLDSAIRDDDDFTTYEDLGEQVLNDEEDKRLVILNTIESANTVGKIIYNAQNSKSVNKILPQYSDNPKEFVSNVEDKETLEEDQFYHIHLTNRHRPVDRKRLLDFVKYTKETTPIVVTSTQILEAGVDISFNSVYRDVAPIQNISQAAGRCNRNGRDELKTVTITKLPHPKDSDKEPPSRAVYSQGTDIIQVTIELLQSHQENNTIPQKELDYDSILQYYDTLWNRTQGEKQYVEFYNNCNLDKISQLSLIDSQNSVDVLVLDDSSTINDVREKFDARSFEEAKNKLNNISKYAISVPLYSEEDEEKVASLEALHEFDIQNHRLTNSQSVFHSYLYGFQIPDSTAESRIM